MTDYSQWGEQQIIAAMLDKLPSRNNWCVDVGAGDGVELSNTRALVDAGYHAVLIEGDTERYESLAKNSPPSAIVVGEFITPQGVSSLEAILAQTATPHDFDLLSIDIDSHDYQVWESLVSYSPKVVIIEFNPTMGVDLNFIQPDGDVRYGSSLKVINTLACAKGYRLQAVTATNANFMRGDLTDNEQTIEQAWTNKCFMTWMFYDYEGKPRVMGRVVSPWGCEVVGG